MAKYLNALQSGMVQQNDVNDPSVRTYRGKNQFPQSFQHPSTCLYGYVDPVAVAKCEVGDVFPYKFVTDLNTFTMKSPMKSKVKMYSAAFKVPMEAIYPRTYDILFAFAQKGDEVPQDSPTNYNFTGKSARSLFPFFDFVNFTTLRSTSIANNNDFSLDLFFRYIFLCESVLSDGGIFAKMNIHVNELLFYCRDVMSQTIASDLHFDDVIDNVLYPRLVEVLTEHSTPFVIYHESHSDGSEVYPSFVPVLDSSLYGKPVNFDALPDSQSYYCSIDRMFELLRTGNWHVQYVSEFDDQTSVQGKLAFDYRIALGYKFYIPPVLNIEPIIAYQLSCVQFFNNPKVDYLYNVQLFRDNLESILSSSINDYFDKVYFEYNGIRVLYDVVSYTQMKLVITNAAESANYIGDNAFLDYFYHLFSYHRSLRYGDYFTGARPEPIGVGDINLEEDSDGNISSLEVARRLQLTRLLHKVAITGPEHKDQIKYIFGGRIPEAPKDVPIRLSREEFDIEGFETNNTGAAQLDSNNPNITTTNLRLSDSKFLFEVEIDEPCWLVMVQYFEAHRIYSRTIDRFAYHYDLYDDFVPDMQFIGDQDVKRSELLGVFGDQFSPYAYHLRNMEYKQRISYASGGFIRHLPSWAFITDNNDGNPAGLNTNPEYLRSSPSEFDRFYKSLLGHSLGRRFHFITMNTNVVAPYRQMVYAPEILA